jgi:hypothetical protein
MNCRDAIREVFNGETGALSKREVITRVYERHPDRPWRQSTICQHLEALSKNRPPEHHNKANILARFLFRQDDGRYRRWNLQSEDPCDPNNETDSTTITDQNGSNSSALNTALSLERDLETCLLSNLGQLEAGLHLYNQNSVSGRQFDTSAVGRIDILAIDNKGHHVVIEVKAGTADDAAVGQLLGYMGWVSSALARGNPVRGIIVANAFHRRVKQAIKALPNVTLRKYEVHFDFSDVLE